MRTAIFASGNLGASTIEACFNRVVPAFIATDTKSVAISEFATAKGIPCFVGNPRKGKLASFASNFEIDVILSINYLFLIEEDVISLAKYPINFHGSLLPKYRGRTPHVWALINNESETGITAHLMEAGCDTGAIVLQEKIAIEFGDTGASILRKFESQYPKLIFAVLDKLEAGNLEPVPQNHALATYFGKRTPKDGQIDWNWSKERILNWVRAQAYPYPGAYSYIDRQKIIIDEIKLNDLGFSWDFPNGLILRDFPTVLVKTHNGVVELSCIRKNSSYCKKNKIFNYEDI